MTGGIVEIWETTDGNTVIKLVQDYLPEWFKEYREHQIRAIDLIQDAYSRVDLVVLDAPTGSGKTLIGESVRQRMEMKGLYICSTKTLQDQFLEDYCYAKVIKGRANYSVEKDTGASRWLSCDDCQWQQEAHESCELCWSKKTCPYEVAKNRARMSRLAVLNTSYYLAMMNSGGNGNRGFTERLAILDEADTLKDEVRRYVTLSISKKAVQKYGLGVPDKITVRDSWLQWLVKTEMKLMVVNCKDPKEQKNVDRMLSRVKFLQRNIERIVYTGDKENVEFKPVTVDWMGKWVLWPYAEKFLLMSATVINPDEMVESLGWRKDYEVVTLGSTFPVAQRPIYVLPHADMSRKVNEVDKLLDSIKRVLAAHPGERVLIHSVSYQLCESIRCSIRDRPVFSYGQASDRASAISQYLATDSAVLVAPSLERGVDFAGDKCRVVVVAKVPFGNLGDKQVAAELYGTRGGGEKYATDTVRKLVQMTGRGMRGESDSCVTYILDSQFVGLWNRNRKLFPKWWSEALDWRFVL